MKTIDEKREDSERCALVPLREHCRQNKNKWPRLSQWHHWIYSKHPIARTCVKKIGGRYLLDTAKYAAYLNSATLEENGRGAV